MLQRRNAPDDTAIGGLRKRAFLDVIRLKPGADRARLAMVQAASKELDGVVIIRDCERSGNQGLGETLRAAKDAYSAHDNASPRPALVIAAPSRCHETWLLADRDATRAVLGDPGLHHFSGNPEDRPHCDDLKNHLKQHAERVHLPLPEVRRLLSFRARPAELAKRCPRCYPRLRETRKRNCVPGFNSPPLPRRLRGGNHHVRARSAKAGNPSFTS
jgi:hypothetical protein